MLIDTHCHLDAEVFQESAACLYQAARQQHIHYIVIPAIEKANFSVVQQLAREQQGLVYALGIHPLYVPNATENDLNYLAEQVELAMADAQFVAIGEIGLDYFVPELCTPEMRDKQAYFLNKQLALAQQFQLPVLLHVRKAQDMVLKYVRRYQVTGIAHAFNGSMQQAEQFIARGFALGIGGAMTFTRAKQIRRLASSIDLEHLVLETDAPDIAPAWLTPNEDPSQYNRPAELAAIAQVLADLRAQSLSEIAAKTTQTAFNVLPRLQHWHQVTSHG